MSEKMQCFDVKLWKSAWLKLFEDAHPTLGRMTEPEFEKIVDAMCVAAHARGREQGIEEAVVMVEEVFDTGIAASIRALKNPDNAQT